MTNSKNRTIASLFIITIMSISQSCKFYESVDRKQLVGVYVANTPVLSDTLIIYENGTYYHVFHSLPKRSIYWQNGTWKSTVENYYDLYDWRADSTAFGGADILPLRNKITGKISFAYPLVTPEDVDYEKKDRVTN